MDVLCVGDAIIDIFLTLHDQNQLLRLNEKKELCVKHGEKIEIEKANFLLGGNACNVSVGLSRMGIKSGLCAEIGDDEFSEKILKELLKEKVNTSFIKQTKDKESSFAIGINFKKERTLFVEHVKRKHNFYFPSQAPKVIYLTSLGEEWRGVYKKTLDYVKAKKIKLAFNPGSRQLLNGLDLVLEVLKVADIIFLNKEEAMRIISRGPVARNLVQGPVSSVPPASAPSEYSASRNNSVRAVGSPSSAATLSSEKVSDLLVQLKSLGPKIVVITDGREGSYSIDENGKIYYLGLFPGDPIERTGAGDAYTTGFLVAMLSKKSVDEAMRFGTINSASVVQKIGAQAGLLKREEMLSILGSYTEFKAKEI